VTRKSGEPLVFAHRGSSAALPEHTLGAYLRALDEGADGLECDVRLTRDGHLVCLHDRRLERTSNGRGLVSSKTLAQRNELARVEEARTLPTARLLEAASVPEMKSFPPRQSIVVLGTLFSFAVAVGWLLVAAYWQRLDARDVRKRVVVEALALVR